MKWWKVFTTRTTRHRRGGNAGRRGEERIGCTFAIPVSRMRAESASIIRGSTSMA
jgi:hypothetical protein